MATSLVYQSRSHTHTYRIYTTITYWWALKTGLKDAVRRLIQVTSNSVTFASDKIFIHSNFLTFVYLFVMGWKLEKAWFWRKKWQRWHPALRLLVVSPLPEIGAHNYPHFSEILDPPQNKSTDNNLNKKLRYLEEHGASVVLSWCTLWHLREKICCWLINHFYVIGQESYRIRRNNAK